MTNEWKRNRKSRERERERVCFKMRVGKNGSLSTAFNCVCVCV